LEFEAADFQQAYESGGIKFGQMIQCPNCQNEFRLMIRKPIQEARAEEKLFPCPACSMPISKMAVSCPHCGHIAPAKPSPLRAAVGFVAAIAFIYFLIRWLMGLAN
jgi:hypothetical protein